LGTRWNGRLERKTSAGVWTFDISADRLDFNDLGRELGRSRQGLLYHIFPFNGPFAAPSELAPQTQAAIARISAQGHVQIHEIELGALRLESLDATADLEHGRLTLRRAQSDLYGGRLSGEFRAQLGNELSYSFHGQVDRTDLSALATLTSIRNGFGGIGSGEVELAAHGLGLQALRSSLEGEGFLHVQDAAIDFLDLPLGGTDAAFQDIAGTRFRSSTVSFRVENGQIRVDPWLLSGRQRQLEIVGNIGFGRRLDLQVRSISHSERVADSRAGDDLWVIGGTLDAPQIVREQRVSAGDQTIVRTGRR
jgi:AsmA-like C-terminal region